MGKYGEYLTPEEQSEVDRELEEIAEDMYENMTEQSGVENEKDNR